MGFLDRFSKKKTEDKKGKEAVKKAVVVKEPASTLKAKDTTTLKPKTETAEHEVKDLKSKKPVSAKAGVKKDDTGLAYKVLIKPLITEKATNLVSLNKYAFKVANNTNKVEVKKAIKALYGYEPVSVNIITERGGKVTYGRIKGRKSNWKKAIITLKAGDKLEIYEGV
jgi:large subunit ribosomal protein L23